MRTILTVIGTRPQYIKYAALLPHLDPRLRIVLVDTGQHYSASLSRGFIEEYSIPQPDHVLASTPLEGLPRLAFYLERLGGIIGAVRPDALLCFGDTDSALAASLAGVKCGIPVMHVEAGERSRFADGSRIHPATATEEANRVLIDQTASLLLCATEQGRSNCAAEGCRGTAVLTGDLMYDLFLRSHNNPVRDAAELSRHGLTAGEYYFATVHRAINTDDATRFANLFDTLNSLDHPVLLPLHPRSAERMRSLGLTLAPGSLRLTDPLPHAAAIALARNAKRVLTDSGGLTREAYFCGVGSVCLDDSTAWHELAHLGWCSITGADREAILTALSRPISADHPPLFGDGHASEAVVAAILAYLGL